MIPAMLLLDTSAIPANRDELVKQLDHAIRGLAVIPAAKVVVTAAGDLPQLTSLTIDLTDCRIDTKTAPKMATAEPATPAGEISTLALSLSADPLRIDAIEAAVSVAASDVVVTLAKSAEGQLLADLSKARDGTVQISLTPQALEAAVLQAAQTGAAGAGVAITKVALRLRSTGPCVVEASLNLTVKKLMTAVIRITGVLSISDQLVATATNLRADGEGVVGSIAVGFLRPHLQKIDGQPLPLGKLPLGSLQLRDVSVDVTNGLAVRAAFGSP